MKTTNQQNLDSICRELSHSAGRLDILQGQITNRLDAMPEDDKAHGALETIADYLESAARQIDQEMAGLQAINL